MSSTVALVIIYNHRYDKNIDILESIYANRFSNIFHIVPFYDGDKKNVIPVYENSFYFQGYLVQAFSRCFRKEFEHYFFVADDMMINPLINENSYKAQLKINAQESYFPEIVSLHNLPYKWRRTQDAVEYNPKLQGVESSKEMPSYQEAELLFSKLGFEVKPLLYKDVYSAKKKIVYELSKLKGANGIGDIVALLTKHFKGIFKKQYCTLNYPLLGGYSDIFVVSASCIHKFMHYCGVFAATELFVELAIPTALVLATSDIRTESEIALKGKAMWTEEDYKIIAPFNNKLAALTENFPKEHLYLHPIKLSKWQTAL